MWVTRVGQQFPKDLKLPKMKNCQSVLFLFSTTWKHFFNHSGTTIDTIEGVILYYKCCKKMWVTHVIQQFPNDLKLPKMKSLLYYKTYKNIWVTCANELFYNQLDYVETEFSLLQTFKKYLSDSRKNLVFTHSETVQWKTFLDQLLRKFWVSQLTQTFDSH